MDMEELSKSQIVLLTLLVSFVTSIATGIVTVSLMEQAPPAIAQTVNRVVERTVERVVPPTEGQAASVVTTEKTIVVKESDLIVQAVDKVTPSLVRVYTMSGKEQIFSGLGFVLDADGGIAIDGVVLGGAKKVSLTFSDDSSVVAQLVSYDESTGIARMKAASTTADGKPVRFVPLSLSTSRPMLGQAVVGLSGRSIPRIADGLITAVMPREGEEDAIIDTNISAELLMQGSPLINIDGALIGVSTSVSRASSKSGFMPATALVPKTETASE